MRVSRVCIAVVAVVSMSFTGAAMHAASIAVNFGADEPDGARSDVTGAAGVLGTPIWNNVDGPAGMAMSLTGVDSAGIGAATAASVAWNTTNTWSSHSRGEENNTAPDGNDRNLMTGYLDQNAVPITTTVDFTGLDSFFSGSVAVYVYVQGGVNGRGGEYTIGAETQTHTVTAAFDGTYLLNDGGNPNGSNYMIFNEVSGSSFTLSAVNTIGATARAGINAVEIVGEASSSLVGDVNLDGTVDTFDFAIIRDNFKTGTTREQGDLNFSGLVEIGDFRIWKDAFNAAPAAVPEPAALTMLISGLLFTGQRRRPTRQIT